MRFSCSNAGEIRRVTPDENTTSQATDDRLSERNSHHMKSRTINLIKSLSAASAAVVALALPAGAAAGPLVATASNCDAQSLSQPFLPWADVASYTLNRGGSFEGGADGWSLNGASVGDGNEPAYVTSSSDSSSLGISNGGSATSASICVGIEHPDIRFFAKGSNSLATLKVEVLFEDGAGNVQSAPIGVVTGSGGWALTPPFPIVVNLLPLLPGSHTAVAFRFTPSGGSFRIDDLYVDPYMR